MKNIRLHLCGIWVYSKIVSDVEHLGCWTSEKNALMKSMKKCLNEVVSDVEHLLLIKLFQMSNILDVGHALFVARYGIGIGFVVGGEYDDRQIFVDQRVRAVLHFARGVTFRVNVGNFLQLERAFQRDGVVDAATEVEEIGVAEELPGEIFVHAGFFGLQDHFNLVRDTREFLQ